MEQKNASFGTLAYTRLWGAIYCSMLPGVFDFLAIYTQDTGIAPKLTGYLFRSFPDITKIEKIPFFPWYE